MVYVVDSASFLSRRKGGNVGVSALVFLSPPSPMNLGLTRTFRVIFNMIYLIASSRAKCPIRSLSSTASQVSDSLALIYPLGERANRTLG